MGKRLLDVAFAAAGLIASAPLVALAMALIWLHDFRSPLYIASRVGRGGKPFRMVKLRSMVANADQAGIDSTAANDVRITAVGRLIRACKLDEIGQLWNVLAGDMSLVGPRPNVDSETRRYTDIERRLLDAKPGITDFSSIVFADEGTILEHSADPDLDYNRLIRPWKSRLALIYVDNRSLGLDVALIAATAVALVSRRAAFAIVGRLLARLGAPEDVRAVARRRDPLRPSPPPGADRPVIAADLYGGQAVA